MNHTRLKLFKLFFFLSMILFTFNQAAAGTLLVANTLSNTVTMLDDRSLQPIHEVAVGYMPHEVAVTPNGQLALVSNFGDLCSIIAGSTLTVIDVANAKVLKTIQLEKRSRPHGIHFLSDSKALVTAQGIQSLLVVDFEIGKVLKRIPLPGSGAHMVKIDGAQRYAYVANTGGSVCKIDLKSYAVVLERKIGRQAEGITLTGDENLLLVTDSSDNYVTVLKTKDLTILRNIPTQRGPVRVVMSDNGNSAVVLNSLSGSTQVIDMASLTIIKTFRSTTSAALLFAPANILVRGDQVTAFISNFLANNISLVDLKQGVVLETFKTGFLPNGLAMSPVTAVHSQHDATFELREGPLEINATPEAVWEVIKQVEDYQRLSKGAITAHVNGTIAVGKFIDIILYKDQWIGKFLPASKELITTVDEDNKILCWQRELPYGAGHTERYQILERTADNKTLSTIILRIPGVIGSVTNVVLKQKIAEAFKLLNEGIKVEMEQSKK